MGTRLSQPRRPTALGTCFRICPAVRPLQKLRAPQATLAPEWGSPLISTPRTPTTSLIHFPEQQVRLPGPWPVRNTCLGSGVLYVRTEQPSGGGFALVACSVVDALPPRPASGTPLVTADSSRLQHATAFGPPGRLTFLGHPSGPLTLEQRLKGNSRSFFRVTFCSIWVSTSRHKWVSPLQCHKIGIG